MATAVQLEIARMYVSFFNRAPDPEGLAYWAGRYNEAAAEGRDLDQYLDDIADSFANSPEAIVLYGEQDASQSDIEAYVTEAYQNMFGRAPDAEGLAYWSGRWAEELENGNAGVRFSLKSKMPRAIARTRKIAPL